MIRSGLLCLLLGSVASCTPAAVPAYDVLITGGTVFDGSLQAGVERDIAIRDGRLLFPEAGNSGRADRVIDATGLYVMPGFIDPHTHTTSDLLDPERHANINYLTQGVTTVFVGSDGGGLPDAENKLATMQKQGIGTNVAFFSGHGSIRTEVMGRDNRGPTADELAGMRERVAADMERGALGLSTGLYYVPGNYATSDEVIELARVAHSYGGVYDTHLRDESSYNVGLLAAIEETLEIARQSGIPVHISHIKALGKDVWGSSKDIIALVEAALDEGLSVTANQYPWRASGTRFSGALVPRWALAGSTEEMLQRLADPEQGPGIRAEMRANMERRGGADTMLVTSADNPWRGKTLAEIAATLELDPIEAAIDVIRDGNPSIASFNMDLGDIERLAVQPWVMTGSDGSTGHPRKYATYPQAWQALVETGLLGVPQFVHRSAGLVADTFHLCDRGYLRDGYHADVVLLDPLHFIANADYTDPVALSEGVRYLFVNGAMVIANDDYTGALTGRFVPREECARH